MTNVEYLTVTTMMSDQNIIDRIPNRSSMLVFALASGDQTLFLMGRLIEPVECKRQGYSDWRPGGNPSASDSLDARWLSSNIFRACAGRRESGTREEPSATQRSPHINSEWPGRSRVGPTMIRIILCVTLRNASRFSGWSRRGARYLAYLA